MANEQYIPARFQQPFFDQFDHDGVYRGSFPLAWIAEKYGLSLDVVYNVAQGITDQMRNRPLSVWSRAAMGEAYDTAQNHGWGRVLYDDIFSHVYAWETRNLSQ